MANYEITVSCLVGYCCMGGAGWNDFTMLFQLSDEEVDALKKIYHGKQRLEIAEIKDSMSDLYERLYSEALEMATAYLNRGATEIEVYFPLAFAD